MNRLETFDYLMDIVDKWQDKKPERYGGSCKALRKDTWVKEIIVTPGFHVSESMLKTFLAAEVLDIYTKWRTDSKVSWKDMRKALAGELKKKYDFRFEELDRCFSIEKNQEAAKKTNMLKEQDALVNDIENWEEVPLYLLNRIQEIFQKKLGEYWRMCSKNLEEEDRAYEMRREKLNDEEKVRQMSWEDSDKAAYDRDKEIAAPKREKYRECVMAVALHEIFVREILRNFTKMREESQEFEKIFYGSLDGWMAEIMNLLQMMEEQEEEEAKVSEEQIENSIKEIKEQRKQLEKFTVYRSICLEHCISMEAEIQLLMLLEVKRLSILGYKIEYLDYLNFIKERNPDDRGSYNKNKKECYRQLDYDVKDIFIFYMKRFQKKEIRDVSDKKIFRAIEKYLGIIEQRNLDDRKREELWNAQCVMITPLMCKALRKNEIKMPEGQ